MKNFVLLLATMALTTASFAQTTAPTQLPTHRVTRLGNHKSDHAKTPEQRADKRLGMLTKNLNLTAEQEPKVRQILLSQAQENQALKAQYPADNQRQARREAIKTSKAKYQAQLQSVLNPGQYGKLVAMKREHHHKGGKHDQATTKS